MPEPIEKLLAYSLETITVPDGPTHVSVPDLTRANLQQTISKLNELIEHVNALTVVSRLED